MASRGNVSRAGELLRRATARDPHDPDERLERNLLVAAALREVLHSEPIVVGGTAEDFWTADEYHPTDLDLVARSLTAKDREVLAELGFTREGRHRIHGATGVLVEFPESRLAGDESRVYRHQLGNGVAPIISVEDLYLDRIRQSTVDPDDEKLPTFRSALAIAASNLERIDWAYIDQAIRDEVETDPKVMRKIHRRVRRRVSKGFPRR